MNKPHILIDRIQPSETGKWSSAYPINYQHPSGAVIWVNLERQVQEKLAIAMQ